MTIFGESAGAYSVDALLTSFPKDSSPPFRAAIAESGQISYRYPPLAPNSFGAWYNLTEALGCPGKYGDNLTCVRAADAATIRQIIDVNMLTFNPIPDNVTLVSNPAKMRLSGNIAPIPVLGGTNSRKLSCFFKPCQDLPDHTSTLSCLASMDVRGSRIEKDVVYNPASLISSIRPNSGSPETY